MYHPGAMTQRYQAYTEANMTVSKTRQVIMLYDGAINFVKQGIEAIEQEDYETRYHVLVKASAVITGLQNSLDFTQGEEIAKLLYDYYASLDARLFSAHRSNDIKICNSVITELKMMREAWTNVDAADKKSEQAEQTQPIPSSEESILSSLSV